MCAQVELESLLSWNGFQFDQVCTDLKFYMSMCSCNFFYASCFNVWHSRTEDSLIGVEKHKLKVQKHEGFNARWLKNTKVRKQGYLYFGLFLDQKYTYVATSMEEMYLVNWLETNCRKSLIPFNAIWGMLAILFWYAPEILWNRTVQ